MSRAELWGVEDVVVRRDETVVLNRVTVAAVAGTVRVVVGGDGAGKTTLLRLLAGTEAADEGVVRRPDRHLIGAMIDVPAVYPDLSVDEHIAFVAASYGVDDRARADELLRRAKLLDARSRLGGDLSGGMRQKLAVVLALLHRPRLLLLDEPTTGVDPVSRAELWRLITHAVAEGAAVLLSTTYLDEAERADVAYILHNGRVLLAGAPSDLLQQAHGAVGLAAARADGVHAWRRGTQWRIWSPDGDLPPHVTPDEPTFEDLVISAELADRPVVAP